MGLVPNGHCVAIDGEWLIKNEVGEKIYYVIH